MDIIKRIHIGDSYYGPVYASYTKYGKAIIQQQGSRACSAGVSAMLIMDNGKKPALRELRERGLADDEDVCNDIKKSGLNVAWGSVCGTTPQKKLMDLRRVLIEIGSSIMGIIDSDIGGHYIVVDEVSEDLSKVRLRDPFHGWEITVKSEAFLKRWNENSTYLITVSKPKTDF